MKDFYVFAPHGGGLHFFSHLTRKHFFKEDNITYHCPLFNEYSIPKPTPGYIYAHPPFEHFGRWIWNVETKQWYFPQEEPHSEYNIIPNHDWMGLSNQDEGILIYPKYFSTAKDNHYLGWLKREFGTSLQLTTETIVSDLQHFNWSNWQKTIPFTNQIEVPIMPFSADVIRYTLKTKQIKLSTLRQWVASRLLPTDGNNEAIQYLHQSWEKQKHKIHSHLPQSITLVYYEDLIEGKKTNTFLDDFTDEIVLYHQRNQNLIKKYQSWALTFVKS